MIVVDTNIIAYSYLVGENTQLAHHVRQKDPQWRLPTLWRHEFLNLLSVYVEHRGCLIKSAIELWQDAVQNLAPCEQGVNMVLTLQIACQYHVSAYDAQFIALAQTLGVLCVTQDQALLRNFHGIAISMKDFVEQ